MATVWQRFNALMLVLVFLTLLALIAMVAMRAEGGPLDPTSTPGSTDSVRLPGTPINEPTVINTPGHYYLTRDIVVVGASTGITIASSNVSLDLGGFMIDGDKTVGSVGISIPTGRDHVVVRNGLIRELHFGLVTEGGFGVIDSVRVYGSVRGIEISGNANTLSNCAAISNSETGIYVPGSDVIVRGCDVKYNNADGITLSGGNNVIERSYFRGNNQDGSVLQAGIHIIGFFNVVRENHITAGALDDVLVTTTTNVFIDNACADATVAMVGGNFGAAPDHLNANCTFVAPP